MFVFWFEGLSLFWSSAREKGFSLHDIGRVMCEEPAKLARLEHCKGRISVGMDADLVLWDPQATFVVYVLQLILIAAVALKYGA